MTRRCMIVGTGPLSGHNVSHSNRKTKRRFLPNLQSISVLSDTLGRIRMKISTRGIKIIDRKGGIDAFLLGSRDADLSEEARKLKRRVAGAKARKSA
jgi:large subunit ribosomal protein L28